jgi:hypothetical protein
VTLYLPSFGEMVCLGICRTCPATNSELLITTIRFLYGEIYGVMEYFEKLNSGPIEIATELRGVLTRPHRMYLLEPNRSDHSMCNTREWNEWLGKCVDPRTQKAKKKNKQGRPLNSNVETRCFVEKVGGNEFHLLIFSKVGGIFLYFKSTVPAIP